MCLPGLMMSRQYSQYCAAASPAAPSEAAARAFVRSGFSVSILVRKARAPVDGAGVWARRSLTARLEYSIASASRFVQEVL